MIAAGIRSAPFLRLAIPLIFGVAWHVHIGLSVNTLYYLSIAAYLTFLILCFWARKRIFCVLNGMLVSALMFFAGAFLVSIASGSDPPVGPHIRLLKIEKLFGHSQGAQHSLCLLRAIDGSVSSKCFVTFQKDSIFPFEEGDELVASLTIDHSFNGVVAGSFDKAAWAWRVGAKGSSFCRVKDRVFLRHDRDLQHAGKQIGVQLGEKFAATGITGKNLAVAKALLLGDKSALGKGQRANFTKSGTVHVLAVSGLHVGLIFVVLNWLLAFLSKSLRARVLKALLCVAALWAYAFITGSSPSVQRAALMFSVFALAAPLERFTSHVNSLAIAALVILLIDPLMLRSLGFQLSFLAVLGIVLFYRPIYSLIYIPNKYLDKLWALACVSLAAQLSTSPLAIYEFGSFPLWFLPANILVVSMVTILVQLGAGLLLFADLPWISDLLALPFNLLLSGLDLVTTWFSALPYAYIAVRISLGQLICMYGMISTLGIVVITKRRLQLLIASLLTLFLFLWCVKVHQSHQRAEFVIHDNRVLLASQLIGRKLAVYGERNAWTERHIEQYLRGLGAELADWEQPDTIASVMAFQDGLLLLSGEAYIDPDVLQGATTLVLSSKLNWRTRRFVSKWAEREKITIHDIRDQGAFLR